MEKNLADNTFSANQERYLREYFAQLDKQLGITKQTPKYLTNQFSRKLEALNTKRAKFFLKGRAVIAALAGAFSIGLLFSQFVLMPTTITTRGYSSESSEAIISPPKVVSLRSDSPKDYAFKIANASLDADVEALLVGSGNKVQVILHSLRANAEEQNELKRMLYLSNEASGDYTVIISPR